MMAAAAASRSRSAIRPSADWTAETATSAVRASIASGRRSSSTSRTRTPRASWASIGNSTDVKSPAAVRISPPGGIDAATSPANTDTWLPHAISPAGTPRIRANAARERSTSVSRRPGVDPALLPVGDRRAGGAHGGKRGHAGGGGVEVAAHVGEALVGRRRVRSGAESAVAAMGFI